MTDPKTDVWMPLWIGSYLADTMKLTTIQHGAYLLLLMAYWRERAPLIDSDDELRSITKTDKSEWKRLRPVLEKFFKVADGVWWHKRVEQEMVAADARAKKASEKAEKAAQARWGANPKDATGNAPSIPQAKPKDKLDECPTPPPLPASSLHSEDVAQALPLDGVPAGLLADYRKVRTAKKAGVITTTVVKALQREADKAGLTLEQAITACCEFGWQGFRADWYAERTAGRGASPARTGTQSEPQWRTEQRERTQQAAPGVAVKNPKDFFFDSEAKNAIPHLVD